MNLFTNISWNIETNSSIFWKYVPSFYIVCILIDIFYTLLSNISSLNSLNNTVTNSFLFLLNFSLYFSASGWHFIDPVKPKILHDLYVYYNNILYFKHKYFNTYKIMNSKMKDLLLNWIQLVLLIVDLSMDLVFLYLFLTY